MVAGLPSQVTGFRLRLQLLDNEVLELSSGLLFIVVGVEVIESEGEPEEAAAVAVADCRCGARFTTGNCTGEPSNSAQPPRKPISTTRSRIRDSSSFLGRDENAKSVRVIVMHVKKKCIKSIGKKEEPYRKHPTTDLCFSSLCSASNRSTKVLTRVVSSVTRIPRSSSWSSTTSRRFALLLELLHVSPIIRAAATENRKPSANALAPFSIALECHMYAISSFVTLRLLHVLDF